MATPETLHKIVKTKDIFDLLAQERDQYVQNVRAVRSPTQKVQDELATTVAELDNLWNGVHQTHDQSQRQAFRTRIESLGGEKRLLEETWKSVQKDSVQWAQYNSEIERIWSYHVDRLFKAVGSLADWQRFIRPQNSPPNHSEGLQQVTQDAGAEQTEGRPQPPVSEVSVCYDLVSVSPITRCSLAKSPEPVANRPSSPSKKKEGVPVQRSQSMNIPKPRRLKDLPQNGEQSTLTKSCKGPHLTGILLFSGLLNMTPGTLLDVRSITKTLIHRIPSEESHPIYAITMNPCSLATTTASWRCLEQRSWDVTETWPRRTTVWFLSCRAKLNRLPRTLLGPRAICPLFLAGNPRQLGRIKSWQGITSLKVLRLSCRRWMGLELFLASI